MKAAKLIKALEILERNFPDSDVGISDEQIWVGNDEPADKIPVEDKEQLEKLGWWVDEECDDWSSFT